MMQFRKPLYATAGYNTIFLGSGRAEFNPKKMPSFESYLQEVAKGVLDQIGHPGAITEGVIGNFMAPRFLNQGNLPGFLPYMIPQLKGKPCTAVEGACGSGGRAVYTAMKTVLSDLSDAVFVCGFEVQNTMKAVYGADVLAGAGYYNGERKKGAAYFFPGVFAERAGAYFEKYDPKTTRQAMARWYEQSILNARKNPKAQEYQNNFQDLYERGLTPPNPKSFVENLNLYDCSKVSDGASGIVIASEEGLKKMGVKKEDAIEIIGSGAAEGDITQEPDDLTLLDTTEEAVKGALLQANVKVEQMAVLELHDCFSITGLLSLEACGLAGPGKASEFVLDGKILVDGSSPVNPSGGLGGFGHPTGASGVRQLVDLLQQFTECAANPVSVQSPFGMMISMGGNDKTVTALVTKSCR